MKKYFIFKLSLTLTLSVFFCQSIVFAFPENHLSAPSWVNQKKNQETMIRIGDGLKTKSFLIGDGTVSEKGIYDWFQDLPQSEKEKILQTVKRALRSFRPHMQWAMRTLPQNRRNLNIREKGPDDWATHMDDRVQARFNDLVRRRFGDIGMSVIGEEASFRSQSLWHVTRDPIDGTSNYMKLPGTPQSEHYLSTLTLLYKTYPVLTIIIAPEFQLDEASERGLWIEASIDKGVRLNENRHVTVSDKVINRALAETVGGMGHISRSGPFNKSYSRVLQEKGIEIVEYENDMAMFLLPFSVLDPRQPSMFMVRDLSVWDNFPIIHVVEALGGIVTDLEGKPIVITEELLRLGPEARIPPILLSMSAVAHQEMLSAYKGPIVWTGDGIKSASTLPEPLRRETLESYDAMVDQIIDRVVTSWDRDVQDQFWLAISGIAFIGKSELAKRIGRKLRARGIESLIVGEDDLGVLGADTMQGMKTSDYSLWKDYRRRIRWPHVHRSIDRIKTAGTGPLTLYDVFEHGKLLLPEKTIEIPPKPVVIIYEGIHPIDPIYPDHTFDGHVLVGGDDEVILERAVNRRLGYGKSREDTEEVWWDVQRPNWDRLLETIDPGTHADLVYDITRFERPERLIYTMDSTHGDGLENLKVGQRSGWSNPVVMGADSGFRSQFRSIVPGIYPGEAIGRINEEGYDLFEDDLWVDGDGVDAGADADGLVATKADKTVDSGRHNSEEVLEALSIEVGNGLRELGKVSMARSPVVFASSGDGLSRIPGTFCVKLAGEGEKTRLDMAVNQLTLSPEIWRQGDGVNLRRVAEAVRDMTDYVLHIFISRPDAPKPLDAAQAGVAVWRAWFIGRIDSFLADITVQYDLTPAQQEALRQLITVASQA